jgi:hypothetical protein
MAITSNATAIVFNDATVQTTAFTGAGAAVIPAGSVMLFFQAAAPTGWTQVTTQNNKALRIVSGTGGGTAGSVAFTTAFASKAVTGSVSITSIAGSAGSTTLTTPQIPSHRHGGGAVGGGSLGGGAAISPSNGQTELTGGDGSHAHPFSFSSGSASFTGTAIDLAVQYIDIILASKD